MLHKSERRKETDVRIRETEAEAVVFVFRHAEGLNARTAFSNCIHLQNGDKGTLTASLRAIQQTLAEILERSAKTNSPPRWARTYDH